MGGADSFDTFYVMLMNALCITALSRLTGVSFLQPFIEGKKTHTERKKKKKPNNNSKTPTSPPPSYTKKYCGGGVGGGWCLFFFLFPMLWWGVKTKPLNRAVFHVGDLTLLK